MFWSQCDDILFLCFSASVDKLSVWMVKLSINMYSDKAVILVLFLDIYIYICCSNKLNLSHCDIKMLICPSYYLLVILAFVVVKGIQHLYIVINFKLFFWSVSICIFVLLVYLIMFKKKWPNQNNHVGFI